MTCQRIGRPPISTSGLGRTVVSSERRVPSPPASRTAFKDASLDSASQSPIGARRYSRIKSQPSSSLLQGSECGASHDNVFALNNPAVANEVCAALTEGCMKGSNALAQAIEAGRRSAWVLTAPVMLPFQISGRCNALQDQGANPCRQLIPIVGPRPILACSAVECPPAADSACSIAAIHSPSVWARVYEVAVLDDRIDRCGNHGPA